MRRSRPTAAQVTATVAATLFLAPLVLMVLLALQPAGRTLPTGLDVLPLPPQTGALEQAFSLEPLGRQLLNSSFIAAVAVPLSVLFASWAGFGMLLLGERWRRRAVALALALLVVPLPALWVPRFVLFSRVDLVDSYVPLIVPALMGTTGLATLLMHAAYRRIPRELIDAARVEGLGPVGTWWRVGEPLARSTAFAVAALVFVAHWGSFTEPLLYLFSRDLYPLPLSLRSLYAVGVGGSSFVLAGALVATLPPVLAFLATQRRCLTAARGATWPAR